MQSRAFAVSTVFGTHSGVAAWNCSPVDNTVLLYYENRQYSVINPIKDSSQESKGVMAQNTLPTMGEVLVAGSTSGMKITPLTLSTKHPGIRKRAPHALFPQETKCFRSTTPLNQKLRDFRGLRDRTEKEVLWESGCSPTLCYFVGIVGYVVWIRGCWHHSFSCIPRTMHQRIQGSYDWIIDLTCSQCPSCENKQVIFFTRAVDRRFVSCGQHSWKCGNT